jgi:hypothetical protein
MKTRQKAVHRKRFFSVGKCELACFLIQKIKAEFAATQNINRFLEVPSV